MDVAKVDAIKAHDILRDALVNQSSLILRRMTMLVTVNSILMAGFFLAVDTPYFSWVSYVLPIVGIVFSVLFGVVVGVGSHLTVKLADALTKVETGTEFEYLAKHKARLELDITGWTKRRLNPNRVGCYLAPVVSIGPMIIWAWILHG